MKISLQTYFALSWWTFRASYMAAFALLTTVAVCLGARASATGLGATPAVDGDGAGAYASGRYRNVFVELGHPEGEVSEKIEAAYQQLFCAITSSRRSSSVWAPTQTALAYITDWATVRK